MKLVRFLGCDAFALSQSEENEFMNLCNKSRGGIVCTGSEKYPDKRDPDIKRSNVATHTDFVLLEVNLV